ncbi:MAG TPA: MFS transporter [Candidatus Polarisedimenticolia bacterium]|nr:MFS transporter [Candidatus Polarisedimenticolia bacterium]
MSSFRGPGVRAFLLIWTGQLVSMLGSGLTAFSLGVWIFQRTASTTQYSLVTFCAALPPLLILPLAGPLIDRWNRKRLLAGCDLIGAATSAGVAILVRLDALSLAGACAIVVITSAATVVQWPAYSATVTLLVPRDQLGRASGLTQLAMSVPQVLAPLLAGALITWIGLFGVALLDVATFLFSAATILAAAIPSAAPPGAERTSYRHDLPFGWRYIFAHAGLLALLLMFAVVNFFTELATVVFTPLVLSFSTPAALGTILAIGGMGMIGGSALMSLWGGPRRSALGVILFSCLGGLAVIAAGVTASVPLLAAAAFLFLFFMPVTAGSSQVIWQRVVPADLQGRVFAVRTTIAMSAMPLASLAAGPLADRLAEPAMAPGGRLAGWLGPLIGTGPGRGIALILIVAGSLSIVAALAALFYPPLRRLDDNDSTVSPAPQPAYVKS